MSEHYPPSRRPFNRHRWSSQHQIGRHQQCHSHSYQQRWPRRYYYHHQYHQYHRRCYRCGDVFHHAHLSHCRARFVRCFSCHRFGHLSRMCANAHTSRIPHHVSRQRLQNPATTVHRALRQVPRTESSSSQSHICTVNPPLNYTSSSVVSEPECLARELPFSTISQAALIPEISANDREFKLEKKLRAVMDRMEENKELHDAECQIILEMRDKEKETSTKLEEEKDQLSKTCAKLKSEIEQIVLENKSMYSKCDNLYKDLEDFKSENSVRINSISRIEEKNQHLDLELKKMEQAMVKIQEERDYWIERSDLYRENNDMLSTETIKMREEIKHLKHNKNNYRSHQKRF